MRSRLLFQLFCQFVRYSVVFVIAMFVMFSPTQRYIFPNCLLLDCRNMAIFLFDLFCFFQMFGLSPMIFAHLAVSLPTPLPLHVRVPIHWTRTAAYPVCASVTKPTHAYATRGTSYCLLTDSTCVRPSLLSVFISSALPQAIIVAAGQRGNAPTVVVVASRAGGRTIPVIISDRPASQPRTLRPLTTPTFDSARRLSVECDTNSDNAVC